METICLPLNGYHPLDVQNQPAVYFGMEYNQQDCHPSPENRSFCVSIWTVWSPSVSGGRVHTRSIQLDSKETLFTGGGGASSFFLFFWKASLLGIFFFFIELKKNFFDKSLVHFAFYFIIKADIFIKSRYLFFFFFLLLNWSTYDRIRKLQHFLVFFTGFRVLILKFFCHSGCDSESSH